MCAQMDFYCSTCNRPQRGEPGEKINCSACGQRLLVPRAAMSCNKTVLGSLEPESPPAAIPVQPERTLTVDEEPESDLKTPQLLAKPWYGWISPGLLALSFLMLPLPFCSLSCQNTTIASQTGLQVMRGNASLFGRLSNSLGESTTVPVSFCLLLAVISVGFSVVVSLAMPPAIIIRPLCGMFFCFIAIVCLVMQCNSLWPIEQEVRTRGESEVYQTMPSRPWWDDQDGAKAAADRVQAAEIVAAVKFSLQSGFYLWLFLILFGHAAILAEYVMICHLAKCKDY